MGEDVELCLEVQVDPASKRILSNPERCRSTLLDVTVVKPKELEAFGTQRTNILRADEVRKLITSMERQRRKKQKFLDKLKYEDTIIKVRKHDDSSDTYRRPRNPFTKHKERIPSVSPIDERKDFIGITESVEPLFCEIRRSLKNVETRITNMQDINLVISQTTVDESASEVFPRRRKRRSPFTSGNTLKYPSAYKVETTPNNLRSVLVCKNRDRYLNHGDKVEGKCLCENCGIVGLLLECQKHPLLTDVSDSPSSPSDITRRFRSRNKKTRFNVTNTDDVASRNYDDLAYINQLTKRVKLLEQRLAMQEERVVPKDYFRKIMSKVVSNISPKLLKSKSELSIPSSIKQDEKKSMKLDNKLVETSNLFDKTFRCKSNEEVKCFHTTATSIPEPCKFTEIKQVKEQNVQTEKPSVTNEEVYNANIWRWGEEILKPGIDLKNRIVTLLTDILSKFALNENCSTVTSVKTNYVEPLRREDCTAETLGRFMRHMNTKAFNAQIDSKGKFLTRDNHGLNCEFKTERSGHYATSKSVVRDTLKRHHHDDHHEKNYGYHRDYHPNKENAHSTKNIDVSYVNPKLHQWRKDSPSEFKAEDKPVEQKNISRGKQEFLKIVSKAKQYQKDVLWRNIWNQARANGQSKTDKITIKIPVSHKDNKGNELFETELSIGEVEEILKASSVPDRFR